MKKIVAKKIKKGCYDEVYELINEKYTTFSKEIINTIFEKVKVKDKFLFLIYAIAKCPDIFKYETLLNVLIFENPFLENYEILVRKYAIEAIEKFPNETDIRELILFMYDDCPSDLFSDEELERYKKEIEAIKKEE